MKEKSQRRAQLRQAMATMSATERAEASGKIRTYLEALGIHDQSVAAFAALPGEPDLLGPSLSLPVGWHLPCVENETELGLFRVSRPGDLVTGAFSIREPDPARCERVSPETIDIFLVPGLGFDPETGHRLGRGKGFYDRMLAQASDSARLIGVAFSRQLGPVPAEPHDIPMSHLLTETGLRQIN